MTSRRRVVDTAFTIQFLVLFGVTPAAAQSKTGGCGNPPAIQNLIQLIEKFQLYGMAIGISLATLAFIVSGILLITGKPDHIKTAQRLIIRAILGLAIIGIASSLTNVIQSIMLSCPG